MMILPREIRPLLESLEPVVRTWPVSLSFDRVAEWLLQFDPEDYDLGARIVRHLSVLGPDDIRSGLSIAYTRLQRKAVDRDAKINSGNTVFAAIGDVGKSGAMMAYEFRIANELPEGNFAEDEQDNYFQAGLVENVVLIDDVIGTGDTAIKEARRVIEETTTLGVKNVFVLAICGFKDAVMKIEEEAGAHAFAAFTYGADDTALMLDGEFYEGLDHTVRMHYLERLKYYNRRCSRSEMGYGNVGALLAFRHNSPNISLPVIWATGNGWKPLFPRVGKISGIENYYAKIAAAQRARQEEPQPQPVSREQLDLTVLVEGNTDEGVMDTLVKRLGLARHLGVKSITTVSVGGVIRSGRLFDLLSESGRRFIMVLDDHPFAARLRGNIEKESTVPSVLLRPNFIGLLDLSRLMEAFPLSREITEDEPPPGRRVYKEYEDRLKAKGFGRTPSFTEHLIEHFIDRVRFQEFIDDLNRAIDALLSTTVAPPVS